MDLLPSASFLIPAFPLITVEDKSIREAVLGRVALYSPSLKEPEIFNCVPKA